MPDVPPGTLWRGSPYLIPVSGQRHSLGWQDTGRYGPCFVVARIGVMGTGKVLDRFPLTEDGWDQAWAALVQLDVGAAQAVAKTAQKLLAAQSAQIVEAERRAHMFSALGVQVQMDEGKVYSIGPHSAATQTTIPRLLGPLAGAEAMVTDGSQAWSPGRALFLPIALTGLATKTKADAAVIFPDGTVHTAPMDGNNAVREAQKETVQFNALARAATPAATETGSDPAVKLRKLQELRDAGLLTQDEYETKRAEIINSI
jgi:hypothetical protein